jgi:hypothetical protein
MSELVWSREDMERAFWQGWGLTHNHNLVRPIYRTKFNTGEEARAFVEAQADQGDPTALKALAIIAKATMEGIK